MIKGQTIYVVQDGKRCYDVHSEVLEVGAQRVRVKMKLDDEYEAHWFRRRNKSGTYECIGMNYFILRETKEEKYHWNLWKKYR